MAQMKDSSKLASEAKILLNRNSDSSELEDPDLEVDPNEAPSWMFHVPDPGTKEWADFVPFAVYPDIGTPWYMSPARWCAFLEKYENKTEPPKPLCWCEDTIGSGVNLSRVGEGTENPGAELIASTASPTEPGNRIICSSIPAPRFYDVSYFEVVLQRTWPLHKLDGDLSSPDGPVGFALGFATIHPESIEFPERLSDFTGGVVIGYDGRVFTFGQEHDYDTSSNSNSCEISRELRAMRDNEEDEYDPTRPPEGPLGWSFAELCSKDRIGLLATDDGYLRLFVNNLEVLSIFVDGLDGSRKLYPIVEICGNARQILLEPFPLSPSLRQMDDLSILKQRTYQLSGHEHDMYSDVYSCGVIARLCFSHVLEAPPQSFLELVAATQRWIEDGRQALETNGDLLTALWEWFDSDKEDVVGQLPREVAVVVEDVLNASHWHHMEPMSAMEFRDALNAETGWSHMSPEFLVSHLGSLGMSHGESMSGERSKKNSFYGTRTHHRDAVVHDVVAEVTWDLTQWVLSASHIRRLIRILQSDIGKRMRIVKVSRFDPKLPIDLLLSFNDCLQRNTTSPDSVDPTVAKVSSHHHHSLASDTKPRLHFGSTLLPVDECNIPFQELMDANAAGIVLRFVHKLNLSRGPEDTSSTPVGALGATTIADALHRNKSLEELSLRGNLIGEDGANVLGQALKDGAVLRKLDLSSNDLGAEGVKVLVDALSEEGVALQSLDLAVNSIGDEGCNHLGRMLKVNNVLHTLRLQQNDIGCEGACALGAALQKNIALEVLDIGRNRIDEAGAFALMRVSRLSHDSALIELNCQDNALDISAAERLAEAIAPPERPMELTTPSGRKSTVGGDMGFGKSPMERRTSQIVSTAPASRKSVSGGLLSHEEAKEGRRGERKTITQIREDGDAEIDLMLPVEATTPSKSSGKASSDAPRAPRRTTIKVDPDEKYRPSLSSNSSSRKQSIAQDMTMIWNTMRRLNLRRNDLASEGAVRIFVALRNNNQLQAVNMAWNNLGKAAAKAFADLFTIQSRCQVEEWDLRDNFLGEDGAVGIHLSQVCKARPPHSPPSPVKWLSLSNNRIDEQGCGHLAEALPLFADLEVLHLYNNPDLCNVRSGTRRHSVLLGSHTEGMLGSMPNMTELRGIYAFAHALPSSLKVLKLGSCAIGDDGVSFVVRHFVGHPCLVELDLSDNGIGHSSGPGSTKLQISLCDLLKSTRTLKQLCLALNPVEDEMAMKFLNVLCTDNPHLETLDLVATELTQAFKMKLRDKANAEEKSSEEQESATSANAESKGDAEPISDLVLDDLDGPHPIGKRVVF